MTNTSNTTTFRPLLDILAIIMPVTACVLATLIGLGFTPGGMPANEIQIIIGCIMILIPSVFERSNFREITLFGFYPHLANLGSLWVYLFGLLLICGGPQCISLIGNVAMHVATEISCIISGSTSLLITYLFK